MSSQEIMKKRRYNAEETKEILIKSAEVLFIKKGFSATSTQDISKAANCSKSQIQYHFKSKRDLWKAVIDRRLNQFFRAIEKLFEDFNLDKDNFRTGLMAFFKYHQKNPQIIAIIKWITIEGNPSDMHLKEEATQLIAKSITRAKKKGIIRNELNPNYIAYAILALVFHWFDMRGNKLDMVHGDSPVKQKDKHYLDTIIGIIYDGIFE